MRLSACVCTRMQVHLKWRLILQVEFVYSSHGKIHVKKWNTSRTEDISELLPAPAIRFIFSDFKISVVLEKL